MKVLGFEAGKAFSEFNRLILQDGSSFDLHEALSHALSRKDNTAMSANISADLVRSDQERRQSAIEELKALLDRAEADVADIYGDGILILRVLPQRMDPARHLSSIILNPE